MPNSVDFSGRPFHFIGIGGIGMSALAHVLARRHYPVSGSDLRLSHITERLASDGVHIFSHQAAENLSFFKSTTDSSPNLNSSGDGSATALLPQVVCSTAIGLENAEYKAAVELGCPIFHRSDILAALMHEYKGIAVAGTHGKTTTSSMIGYLLLKAGLSPSIVVGGEVSDWGGNAYVGDSDYMVAEADESDGTLVKLASHIGVITNIELDHPDHYSSLEEVVEIFKTFADQCQTVIASLDCPTVKARFSPTLSYSLNPDSGADYIATNIGQTAQGITAEIWERGQSLGQLSLQLLGEHNLSNALAAVAVGRLLGIEFGQIAAILPGFKGASRRFDRRGFYNDILFVDDYAHHPSEIKVTLAAAKVQSTEPLPSVAERRVVAVFQPHRYSRVATFLDEFMTSFADADRVIVSDIYAASEVNETGITGQAVADAIATHHPQVEYHSTLEAIEQTLIATLQPGDVVLFLTAGNLNRIIPTVMAAYQSPSARSANAATNKSKAADGVSVVMKQAVEVR
jgi:UDP-N-acetylmuramate--alanine ligase